MATTRKAATEGPKNDIWPHLYFLDEWGRCSEDFGVSSRIQTPNYSSQKEPNPHKRLKQAADALALICASAEGVQCACGIEGISDGSIGGMQYLLRLAQDGGVSQSDLDGVQTILEKAAQAVDKTSGEEWRRAQKSRDILTIVDLVVLPLIIARCKAQLSATFSSSATRDFDSWATGLDLTAIPRLCHEHIHNCIYALRDALRTIEPRISVQGAEYLLQPKFKSLFGPAMAPVTRFLEKLASYSVAAQQIVKCLVSLRMRRDTPTLGCFRVVAAPVLPKSATPLTEGAPALFEMYISNSFAVDPNRMDAGKTHSLRGGWGTAAQDTLVLHTEMQLALYYSIRPDISLLSGYIGVSEPSCLLCSFVINALQIDQTQDPRYAVAAVGPPMFFCVQSTDGDVQRMPRSWWFPDLHVFREGESSLSREQLLLLQNRLALIRAELASALRVTVAGILPHLYEESVVEDDETLLEMLPVLKFDGR